MLLLLLLQPVRFKQVQWLCSTKEFGESSSVVASYQSTKWRSNMRGKHIVPESGDAAQGIEQERKKTESDIDDDNDFIN